MTGRTVRAHAEQINELSEGETYEATISDHDASDRATLAEDGISTVAADKDILQGIEKVQQRLKVKENGKPSIFFLRDSLVEVDESLKARYKPTCTEEEFPGYVFPERKEGKSDDEKPVKVDDHGMDEVRYLVSYVDKTTHFDMDWM
jgi:phage terminase large subunit